METNREIEVLETPIWMLAIRGAQVLLSVIILAMAGYLMHGAYLDEHGLCVAIALITWIVVAYIVVSEKFVRQAYNVIAVIVLDGVMVILWLATFAATAAKRAQFVVPVNVSECASDGSLVNSITCARRRSLLTKRGTLLFKSGQAMMSANAGLGALVWLMFIATFAWTMVMFFKGRKEGRFLFDKEGPSYQMEAKAGTTTTTTAIPTTATPQPQTTGNFEKPEDYPQNYAQANYPPAQYPQGTYPPPTQTAPYQPATSPSPVYPQQGYYGGSELSGSEVHGQPGYYGSHTQSPPPAGQQFSHPQ